MGGVHRLEEETRVPALAPCLIDPLPRRSDLTPGNLSFLFSKVEGKNTRPDFYKDKMRSNMEVS